jgi:hypothetical protein
MVPNLLYRGYQFYYPEPLDLIIQRLDWMVKNGVNYVTFTPLPDDAAEPGKAVDPKTGEPEGGRDFRFTESWWKNKVEPEIFKRGLKMDFNHHNLFYWIPPQRYFAEHPEWYPLIDGQRTAQPNKQLAMCTSNEDAVKTLVENVKQYLRGNPSVKVVGVIVEDGTGWCQCENCRRTDPDPQEALRPDNSWEYKTPGGESRGKCLRYARLVNHVARAIRTEFPDVLVGHAAYGDIQWPPRGLELEPNVISWVAIYWRDAANPLSANSPSPVNRFFFDILEQWKAAQKSRVILYEYYMGMDVQKSLPYPMSEVICRDWPHLKKLGIEGATIQSWSTNHESYGLNNLAFARNAWEDRVDHDSLLDGYLLGMFGSAAVEIKPIFERLIGALKKVEKEGPQVSTWLAKYDAKTPKGGSFLPDAYTLVYLLDTLGPTSLDRAVGRARERAMNEREKRQVEMFATVVAYWKKAEAVLRLNLLSLEAERKGRRADAAAMLTEAAEKCGPVLAFLETIPPRGWVSVTTPRQWHSLSNEYRKRAEELRKS